MLFFQRQFFPLSLSLEILIYSVLNWSRAHTAPFNCQGMVLGILSQEPLCFLCRSKKKKREWKTPQVEHYIMLYHRQLGLCAFSWPSAGLAVWRSCSTQPAKKKWEARKKKRRGEKVGMSFRLNLVLLCRLAAAASGALAIKLYSDICEIIQSLLASVTLKQTCSTMRAEL